MVTILVIRHQWSKAGSVFLVAMSVQNSFNVIHIWKKLLKLKLELNDPHFVLTFFWIYGLQQNSCLSQISLQCFHDRTFHSGPRMLHQSPAEWAWHESQRHSSALATDTIAKPTIAKMQNTSTTLEAIFFEFKFQTVKFFQLKSI